MALLVALLCALVAPSFLRAQGIGVSPGSISGSIAAPPGVGSSIEGLIVTVNELGQATKTDKNGVFSIVNILPGNYSLQVAGSGFRKLTIVDIVVESGRTTVLKPQTLQAAAGGAGDSVVSAQSGGIETMSAYYVSSEKPKAFLDQTVSLPRSVDDEQPYYIVDSQKISNSGATSIEQLLSQNLSMDVDMHPLSAGWADTYGETSQFNLRGLGTNETLILVDGRRLPTLQEFTTSAQPDVNGIPLAAVDRIEILPSSAAAIYGGSALGGVINIILKKDYSGGSLQYTYDTPMTATSAKNQKLDLTLGQSLEGGKTHLMISAHWGDGSPLTLGDRSVINDRLYEAFQRGSYYGSNPNPLGQYNYSASTPYYGGAGNIVLYPSSYTFDLNQPAATDASTTSLTYKSGVSLNSLRTFVPYGTSPTTPASTLQSGLSANANQFNYVWENSPTEFGQQAYANYVNRDKSFMASVRRDMTPNISAFASVYTDSNISFDHYDPQGGLSVLIPSSFSVNPFAENISMNLPGQLNAWNENGDVTHQVVFGLTAKLPKNWTAEFDYTWGESLVIQTNDYFDTPAFLAAMQAGAINPFVDTQAFPVNLQQFDNIETAYYYPSTTNDLQLHLSGPAFQLPAGNDTLSLGAENRKEGYHNGFTSEGPTPGDPWFGINGSDYSEELIENFFGQDQDIRAFYLENELPVFSHKNAVPLIRELSFQAALTEQRYSVGSGPLYDLIYPLRPSSDSFFPGSAAGFNIGSSRTDYSHLDWTLGTKYNPVDSVTLRASYATSFLPPTYQQLGAPQPATQPPATQIVDPSNGQSYLVSTISGGNPNLKPQTSKSWDAGVIFEPKSGLLKGLRANLEFYSIQQFNVIETPSAAQVVSNPVYASRVTRSSTTGLITVVDLTYLNANRYKTDGYDLTLDYRKSTGWGNFEISSQATIEEHDKRELTVDTSFVDFVGWSNSGGEPKTKGSVNVTWNRGPWLLGWTVRYVDGYKQFGAPGDPDLFYPGSTLFASYPHGYTYYTWISGNTIPSQTYHDVFAKYSFGNRPGAHGVRSADFFLANTDVTVGVRDLFNTVPPFDPFSAPAYANQGLQTMALREVWLAVRKNF